MGLGKTVELLACISAHKFQARNAEKPKAVSHNGLALGMLRGHLKVYSACVCLWLEAALLPMCSASSCPAHSQMFGCSKLWGRTELCATGGPHQGEGANPVPLRSV